MKAKEQDLWLVEDRADGRAFWTKIGVATENRDGSWTLDFSAFPRSGRVLMREKALTPEAQKAKNHADFAADVARRGVKQ